MAPDVGGFVVPRSLKGAHDGRPGTTEAYGRPYAPEFGAYPRPRVDRIGAPTSPTGPGGATAPQTRIVVGRISVGGNQRSTRSYGPFQGPAIVDSAVVDIQSAAGAFTQALDIGYNPLDVEESLVSTALPRTWNSFFFRNPVQGTDLSANIIGEPSSSDLTQVIRYAHRLKGVVALTEWWLVVSAMSDSATGIEFVYQITCLLGVDPGALANFL